MEDETLMRLAITVLMRKQLEEQEKSLEEQEKSLEDEKTEKYLRKLDKREERQPRKRERGGDQDDGREVQDVKVGEVENLENSL